MNNTDLVITAGLLCAYGLAIGVTGVQTCALPISGGELRYQATPRGSIIGFYGYADTYDKAYQLLMRNATKDNHNNCRYCAAGEAYNHNPEEVKA